MVDIKPPKGPFRTKNTTTVAKMVAYYAVVSLLRPPNFTPFSTERSTIIHGCGGSRPRF